MKRFIGLLTAATILFAAGCEQYDDSPLQERVGDLEQRVTKLEELCKRMNSDISSLQTLVKALQENDYVTSVTPVIQNGETTGYTISFSKSAPITIYNGKDGQDGQDGKDGITPQFKIKDGCWSVSSDGGYSWSNLGKATGTDGKDGQDRKDGKDSIFKSVTDVFYGISPNATLQVPSGCVGAYKDAYGWSNFANITELVE